MKLLYCPNCGDLFNLSYETKSCMCEHSSGKYTDDINAIYSGGIPIGFANSSFIKAIKNQPEKGMGEVFTAFVIPQICPTMKNE